MYKIRYDLNKNNRYKIGTISIKTTYIYIKYLGTIKPKGLNRIDKIS
jgi:hypothetical protein